MSGLNTRLMLAPMEGVADHTLRDMLTRIGGYDSAVSEFVRVSDSLLPCRTFRRICPEIGHDGRTPSGTPVAVQLLGSDPHWLGVNAARLGVLSPHGVDLNFGCPARTVNRHGSGAMLLDRPELLHRIVCAVRAAVAPSVPVTAKMRLGTTDTSLALDCARALTDGGITALVVHARTRVQGYRAPAHWEWIARIRSTVSVRVVSNGEIWTVDDWRRCCEIGGSDDIMLGRGAVSDPWLALRIRGLAGPEPELRDWHALLPYVTMYWRDVRGRMSQAHALGRLKLWLGMLRRTWPEAERLYARLRPLNDGVRADAILREYMACLPSVANSADEPEECALTA